MSLPRSDIAKSTGDLQNLLRLSELVNENSPEGYKENFAYSFTSILLAFILAEDPLSLWFQKFIEAQNIDVNTILKDKGISREKWQEIVGNKSSIPSMKLNDWTSSARNIFTIAEKYLRELENKGTGSSISDGHNQELDVRHILGAYIYGNHGHEGQMRGWGFQTNVLSKGFIQKLATLKIGSYELEYWTGKHASKFGETISVPKIEIGSTFVNKLAKYLESDKWTTEDQLNYLIFAHSLYRFLTHPQTSHPLCISIQAPWGGGKTSLMKMLQQNLDPGKFDTEIKIDDKVEYPSNLSSSSAKKQATVKDILRVITNPISILIKRPELNSNKKLTLTVWFNAWKYDSTQQVWAGLVDAILQQVGDKMNLIQREIFYLNLNKRRIDANKIRKQIYDTVLNQWWRTLRPWLIPAISATGVLLLTSMAAWISNIQSLANGSGIASVVSGMFGAGTSITKYFQTRSKVEDEPAEISFGNYLTIPDYRENLGFIHHAVKDVEVVFSCIDKDLLPVVIFIDDLDRCSPNSIARVMEGINLFQAGEFENCIIVMGMDSDLVAAALEVEHEKVISKLPTYTKQIPIGWKFMDKFVQLPIIIPPATEPALKRYIRYLLAKDVNNKNHREVVVTPEIVSTDGNVESRKPTLQYDKKKIIELADAAIDRLSDQDEEFQEQIIKAASDFSSNPRDIKRFMNLLRFQRFMWEAVASVQNDLGEENEKFPTLDQLGRWTVLSLKWPSLVRWIYSEQSSFSNTPENSTKVSVVRMKLLEDLSEGKLNEEHFNKIQKELRLDPKSVTWLKDENMWQFFKREKVDFSEKERISNSIGQGVY